MKTKIVCFLLFAFALSAIFIGCGNDESDDNQSGISPNSEISLVGMWNLVSYMGNPLPFVNGQIGTKKTSYTLQKYIFNDDGMFINEMFGTIQDYEDTPIITTMKGTYTIIDDDTLITQLTEIAFFYPDEIKEFYKSMGIDIDKGMSQDEITKDSYEPKTNTFELYDDTLTILGIVVNEIGKETLEEFVYKREKSQ